MDDVFQPVILTACHRIIQNGIIKTQILSCKQHCGLKCISLYPYQMRRVVLCMRVCIAILLTIFLFTKEKQQKQYNKMICCELRILTKFAWIHTTRHIFHVFFDFVIPFPFATAASGAAFWPLVVSGSVCN